MTVSTSQFGGEVDHTYLASSTPGLAEVDALIARLAAQPGHAGVMIQQHLATGGKRFRARLALQAGAALGVDASALVPWAAAVELLHQATLVHDDIQDGDIKRRGEPTVWVRHGKNQAINAGDLLLMLPYLAIAEAPAEARGVLSELIARYAVKTVVGQVDEMNLLTHDTLTWDSYLQAIEGKTGAIMALPVHGAALLAGVEPLRSAAIAEAFVSLGTLFQLQDDVLDLYGDKGRDRVGCDLYEGKVSALVIAHLVKAPAERDALFNLLRTPREKTAEDDVMRAIASFRESGALADVLAAIEALASKTVQASALANEPGLRTLVRETVALATRPIAHITSSLRKRK